MKRTRINVTTADVQVITGKGERHAQKLLQNLRFLLKKQKHQLITVQEFSDYYGIDSNLLQSNIE